VLRVRANQSTWGAGALGFMPMATEFFEYEGNPAYRDGGKPRRLTKAGESLVDETTKFAHEATPISKDEFDKLKKELGV
jgi:hypothetical protein